jgi:hypothetical protein
MKKDFEKKVNLENAYIIITEEPFIIAILIITPLAITKFYFCKAGVS